MENRCLLATGPAAALVADIVPGTDPSNPENLVNANGTLFFGVWDPSLYPNPTRSLWKSDGTSAGTERVVVTERGADNLTQVDNLLYFTTNEIRLWVSDGTAAGTIPVSPYIEGQDPGPYSMTPVGNGLFFSWNTRVTEENSGSATALREAHGSSRTSTREPASSGLPGTTSMETAIGSAWSLPTRLSRPI
jgi:ELWxxDGT repeat protein